MRKQEISFLNTVLCLLVMFIHICSPAVIGLQNESTQFACVFLPWRASAFVVQGFLFLSALKFFRGMQKEFDYSRFLWGRAKKIGIPYVIATVLSYFGILVCISCVLCDHREIGCDCFSFDRAKCEGV